MENGQFRAIYEAYCQVHCARKELLNLVCLSLGCQGAGLLCRLCCSDNHQGHDTVTTTQLAEDIESLRFDKSLATKSENTLSKIKEVKAGATSLFKETRA